MMHWPDGSAAAGASVGSGAGGAGAGAGNIAGAECEAKGLGAGVFFVPFFLDFCCFFVGVAACVARGDGTVGASSSSSSPPSAGSGAAFGVALLFAGHPC